MSLRCREGSTPRWRPRCWPTRDTTSSVCRCSSTTSRQGDISFGSCCTLDDLHDARRVAAQLGFPHYILNFERQFGEQVISRFVHDYASARTPIPCVRCNSDLKFTTLLDRARAFDAPTVATGHYARVDQTADGRYRLRRGVDAAKDQSYFLFSLTQDQLARASFPLGELNKTEVRAVAARRRLSVANKPDSHEICFVPDGDYAAFVEQQVDEPPRPGPITDAAGRTLGRHDGVHRYTVGQRKGLGVSAPVPLYVTALDAVERHRHGRTARGARAHQSDRVRRELDWTRADRTAAHRGPDSTPARGGRRHRLERRRRPRHRHLRPAPGGDHPGPGRRLLSGRYGVGRRLDRVTSGQDGSGLEVPLGVDRRHAA